MDKNSMLGEIVRRLVGMSESQLRLLYDLTMKLVSGDEVVWVALKRFLRKEDVVWPKEGNVLKYVSSITFQPRGIAFIPQESFVLGGRAAYQAKIKKLGTNFTEDFLSGGGMTEYPHGEEKTVRRHDLINKSVDSFIIDELGGTEVAPTPLWVIYEWLLKSQDSNPFYTTSHIFYAINHSGILHTVLVRWGYDGWEIDSYSVVDPNRWDIGDEVYSLEI